MKLGFGSTLLPTDRLPHLQNHRFDAVVVGAGVAGLTFALGLPRSHSVAVLTKGALGESNTRYAQGGLSAPIGADDSIPLHVADTLNAGAGLCDPKAVEALISGAPAAVDWLLSIGTIFDKEPTTGEIQLGMEAAHSRRRVLHAGGDATGAEIERSLVVELRSRPNISVYEHAFALDLMSENQRCVGVLAALTSADMELSRLTAPVVVMAAGGAGQLWATTSNPLGATADGLAMAIRAGVAIADSEFVQFHPTVLDDGSDNPFLISEAVRGEGAYLRNQQGERFMQAVHELAELAPRDVVARGIQNALATNPEGGVFLDLRHLDPDAMQERFPSISKELSERGYSLTSDLIPVAPAAHYFIGGIVAGTEGSTSLPGLLALGEASCTGVHGANRLASNSLLEGLVFGHNAALAVGENRSITPFNDSYPRPAATKTDVDWLKLDTAAVQSRRKELQSMMSRYVSVVRNAHGLQQAIAGIDLLADGLDQSILSDRAGWQLINMMTSANAVATAASQREESRGAHFRSDFPATDPELQHQHQYLAANGEHWAFGTLDEARLVQSLVQ